MTLAGFDAQQVDGHVLVAWETVSEIDNAGFNLYRNTTPDPVGDLLAYVPPRHPARHRASLTPTTTGRPSLARPTGTG